ncbi:MAG TPA: hypothetical protein VI299_25750 [Polyangiales bacterium]
MMVAWGGCTEASDTAAPEEDLNYNSAADAGHNLDSVKPPDRKDASADREDARTHEEGPDGEDASAQDASTDASPMVDASVQMDAGNTVSFSSVYAIISTSCTGCHAAGKPLDLSTPELALAGMVGASAHYAACGGDGGTGRVVVVAGNPDESLLIQKLEGVQTCGKQMPPKALLTSEQVAVFRAWVAAGASAQ